MINTRHAAKLARERIQGKVELERWDEVIHCIKVKRFPEAANLLLKYEKPNQPERISGNLVFSSKENGTAYISYFVHWARS